jgi:hypothetical protein
MSKLTFKQFLDEDKKDNSKRPQPNGRIKLKPQVKPIGTKDEKRVPSDAELKLKALLKNGGPGHARTLADVLGIYPT